MRPDEPRRLVRWQWDGYPRVHRSRTNLPIHIVVVPLFVLGNIGLVVALRLRSLGWGPFRLSPCSSPWLCRGVATSKSRFRPSHSLVRPTQSRASFSNSGSPFPVRHYQGNGFVLSGVTRRSSGCRKVDAVRLWTLHPRYLDSRGLTALWREALLLARKVFLGGTRGYRHHPQLRRFQSRPNPVALVNTYLFHVHAEARRRGFAFDSAKLGSPGLECVFRRPSANLNTSGVICRETPQPEPGIGSDPPRRSTPGHSSPLPAGGRGRSLVGGPACALTRGCGGTACGSAEADIVRRQDGMKWLRVSLLCQAVLALYF